MTQLTELRTRLETRRIHILEALDAGMFNTVVFHGKEMVDIQEQIDEIEGE